MGAPMLRPDPKGPFLDAKGVAELVGRPVDAVYEMTRVGELPAPINRRYTLNPRLWRWSRRLIQAWAEGRWQPEQLEAAS